MMSGERSPDGILLHSTDVAKFFGMDRLIKTLFQSGCQYEEIIHFVVLEEHSGGVHPVDISSKIPKELSTELPKRQYVSHDSSG
jgi:hypothetical protein